jgi:hypothetical protein
MLEDHIAAVLIGKQRHRSTVNKDELFDQIVKLKTGEALVFCPTAVVDVVPNDDILEVDIPGSGITSVEPTISSSVSNQTEMKVKELGSRYIRLRIRNRITMDGGRSILAE